ncbi:glycoside hydrolase family 13 protein [Auriscalpium vulgare]|uniref:Glycoside hydrolase family 13 protein n=1 Tax=Auriscalpium vulgare TaxID=40419 RepID=A0ACB8RF04_9AGAM|nr:glycoside hydrolase family 13 protein [Auriscalpium vulgare]
MLWSSALALFSTLLLARPAIAANATDWSTRSIYQLITDRFATTNDAALPCDTVARRYCGGSWKGIINHLDYIQHMGFDAVWISPVSTNIDNATAAQGEAFHGYWTKDLTTLNSHFGQPEDLKALADALHKRGMYLMLDVVVNHMASPTMPPNFTDFYHPFTDESFFHRQCFVGQSLDQNVIEQCWLGDETLPLPDLNTDNSTVADMLHTFIHDLVKNYTVDGLRIDTVKHINKDFWPAWVEAAGVFTMGEVLINDTDYAAPFTGVIDAILDYPTYFPLVQAFVSPDGKFSTPVQILQKSQQTYKNGLFRTGSFVENHDQARFPSMTKDVGRVRNAMTFPFLHDGIPITYYGVCFRSSTERPHRARDESGQEQGYQGGQDPFNREALWFAAYQQDKPLVQHYKTLNLARKEAITGTPSFLTTPMKFLAVEDNSLAISKPPMLGLLTNIGSDTSQSVTWTVPALYSPNEVLLDILTCSKVTTDAQGGVTVQSMYGMPQVLMPASSISKNGGLCPGAATGTTREKNVAQRGVRVQSSSWMLPVVGALLLEVARRSGLF